MRRYDSTEIGIIVFSKNRPLQLDLCLKSMDRYTAEIFKPKVNVLYTCDPEYRSAYVQVFNENPFCTPVFEQNFKENLLKIVKNKRYILFVTDDTIFRKTYSFYDIISILSLIKCTLGVSLRLGVNTTYCYPLDAHQNVPKSFSLDGGYNFYLWENADKDFGYPLELSSSIYPSEFIMPLLENLDYRNPNELEALLSMNALIMRNIAPFLVMPTYSIAFANPINRVQSVATANRYGGNSKYSSENLLTKYQDGVRINPMQFENVALKGCHQEVTFEEIENA